MTKFTILQMFETTVAFEVEAKDAAQAVERFRKAGKSDGKFVEEIDWTRHGTIGTEDVQDEQGNPVQP